MRRSEDKLSKSLKTQLQKTLAQTIADISKLDDAHIFLNDFLTESEYESLAKRLAIAYWLEKNRSYENIMTNIKVSSATIASVQSMSKNKGFKLAIKNIEADEWANKWEEKIKKFMR